MRLLALIRRLRPRRRRLLVCRRAVELMTDYLEGTMSPPARRRFEAHLAACPACTAYLAQMRATVAAVGRLEPDELPPRVLDELVGLYRRVRAAG